MKLGLVSLFVTLYPPKRTTGRTTSTTTTTTPLGKLKVMCIVLGWSYTKPLTCYLCHGVLARDRVVHYLLFPSFSRMPSIVLQPIYWTLVYSFPTVNVIDNSSSHPTTSPPHTYRLVPLLLKIISQHNLLICTCSRSQSMIDVCRVSHFIVIAV